MFVLDNNFIIDVVTRRSSKSSEYAKVLAHIVESGQCAIPSCSLHNLEYVLRKQYRADLGRYHRLLPALRIIKTPSYVDVECDLAGIDIEDYLIEISARAVGGHVITSDKVFLKYSELAIHPDDYFDVVRKQQHAIPFCDLKTQYQQIRPRIEQKIDSVLTHGQYIMGPEVAELEQKLCAYTEAKHCITCASGTDALLMALMALGIGPGDEVITSPFTFVATGEVISLVGATPVFVDIDPRTFNIDPSKIAPAITNKTRAIIPVSLFGLPADMDAIAEAVDRSSGEDRESFIVHRSSEELKQNHQPSTINHQPAFSDQQSTINDQRIYIIEDAAQSFGATYKGRKSCNLSTLACTSFFPAKPLGCYGDGGAIFTDNDELAEILRSIRIHGKGSDKYDNIRIGINGRLDTLQAAILLPKLEIFPAEIEARQKAADTYTRLLSDLHDQLSTINNQQPLPDQQSTISDKRPVNDQQPLPDQRSTINDQRILTPFVPSRQTSAWAQYSILLDNNEQRDNLQKQLAKAGVPSAVYYPKPLHLQTAYSGLGYQRGDFPVSEDVSERILSLPMGPYVKEDDQGEVVEAVCRSLDR